MDARLFLFSNTWEGQTLASVHLDYFLCSVLLRECLIKIDRQDVLQGRQSNVHIISILSLAPGLIPSNELAGKSGWYTRITGGR